MSRLLQANDGDKDFVAQKTKNDVGPIRWSAPESMFQSEYSKMSDCYMFGMFMYEVLFRQIPFYNISNLLDVSDAVLAGKRPDIPPDFDVLQSC